jgi:hypothetical protein
MIVRMDADDEQQQQRQQQPDFSSQNVTTMNLF